MAERYTSRQMGGRKDGRRLRTLSSTFQLTPYLMRDPSDAVNSFIDQAETSAIEQWVLKQRSAGYEDISLMHIVIAAYVRTVAQYPALNRFITGRYMYARDRIEIILSSGRNGSADAGALAVKVRFLPTDTVFDICRKIHTQIDSIKADEEADRIERFASILTKTPRFVVRLGLGVMRWLDYHGWLSAGWLSQSPFHGSAVISDEGADGLPPISRSLSSIGSIPMSVSIGRRRAAVELTRTGAAQERHYVDYCVSVDSRIADSAYIGGAFKSFRRLLADPSQLETAPSRVNEDNY